MTPYRHMAAKPVKGLNVHFVFVELTGYWFCAALLIFTNA